jgi:hypothetical protein
MTEGGILPYLGHFLSMWLHKVDIRKFGQKISNRMQKRTVGRADAMTSNENEKNAVAERILNSFFFFGWWREEREGDVVGGVNMAIQVSQVPVQGNQFICRRAL